MTSVYISKGSSLVPVWFASCTEEIRRCTNHRTTHEVNSSVLADRLAQPAQGVANRRGSYRKYLARFTHTAMQHHGVEHSEQIEVDHAKARAFRLHIIPALLGFAFFQRSKVSLDRLQMPTSATK
jgi:hypothetical protein